MTEHVILVHGLWMRALAMGALSRRLRAAGYDVSTFDYASVGPEHAYLRDAGRIEYTHASDDEALEGFQLCSRLEGIIPALESSHAIAYAAKLVPTLSKQSVVIVNMSGRGDKDVVQAAKFILNDESGLA